MSDFHSSTLATDVGEILQTGNISSILALWERNDSTTSLAAVDSLFELLNQGDIDQSTNSPLQDEFRENDGISQCLNLSKTLRIVEQDDVSLSLRCRLIALMRVVARNPVNKIAFNELGGIDEILQLIQDTKFEVRVEAMSVMINLVAAEENQHAVRQAGGLQILLHYFSTFESEQAPIDHRSDHAALLLYLLESNIENQMAVIYDTDEVVDGVKALVDRLRDPSIYVVIQVLELLAKLSFAVQANEELSEFSLRFIEQANGLTVLSELFLPGTKEHVPLAINSIIIIGALIGSTHGVMTITSILNSSMVFDAIVQTMLVPWNADLCEYAFSAFQAMFDTLEQVEDQGLAKDLTDAILTKLNTKNALTGLFRMAETPNARSATLKILQRIINHHYSQHGFSSVPTLMLTVMGEEDAFVRLLTVAVNEQEDEDYGGYGSRCGAFYFLTLVALTPTGSKAMTTVNVLGIERVLTHLQNGHAGCASCDAEDQSRHNSLMDVALAFVEALVADNVNNQQTFRTSNGFTTILPFIDSEDIQVRTTATQLVRALVSNDVEANWTACRELGIIDVLFRHFTNISLPKDLQKHAGAALSHLLLGTVNKEVILRQGIMSKLAFILRLENSSIKDQDGVGEQEKREQLKDLIDYRAYSSVIIRNMIHEHIPSAQAAIEVGMIPAIFHELRSSRTTTMFAKISAATILHTLLTSSSLNTVMVTMKVKEKILEFSESISILVSLLTVSASMTISAPTTSERGELCKLSLDILLAVLPIMGSEHLLKLNQLHFKDTVLSLPPNIRSSLESNQIERILTWFP